MEACLAAVTDAGLTRDDIDGLATYPGMGAGTGGFAGPSSPEVQDALRLRLNWHDGGGEGPGQMRAVIAACLAVAAGLARHVLVYRTVSESTAQGSGGRQGIGGSGGGGGGGVPRFSGFLQWSLPFGAVSAVNWLAVVADRRMHEFSLTREQLGQIAINGRRNAADNPKAVYRDPMDLADYLEARMISTPLCLFDCDAPSDGSTAFVVSHRDYAPDAPRPACHVNAVGTALRGRASWDQFDDPTTMAARDAAASMWERTDLRPTDVDVAQLYDGFSILAMVWLEATGLLRPGRERSLRRGRDRHLRVRACCRSTPPGASYRAAGSTGSASSTRRASSSGARVGPARCTAAGMPCPRWRRSATGAGPSPAPCCSPAARADLRRRLTRGQTIRWAARAARAARVRVGP